MQKADVFFRKLVSDSKNGGGAAICSVCSSNELVLEAALEEGARTGGFVLIEATANQVNQYGGYTGMTRASIAFGCLSWPQKPALGWSVLFSAVIIWGR